MASFEQWFQKFPENKKLTFVCGPAKDLAEFVLRSEVLHRKEQGFQVVDLEGSAKDIGDRLLQTSTKSVFVVRNFDRIRRRDTFIEFLKFSDSHLIIVSNATKPDTKEKVLKAIIGFGRYVRCVKLEDLGSLIKGLLDISSDGVEMLVSVTAGNLMNALNEVKKLSFLKLRVTGSIVRQYCIVSFSDTFVDDLFLGKKEDLLRLCSEGSFDIGRVLGQLEYRLRQITALLPVRRVRLSYMQLSERSGVPLFLIKNYMKVVNNMSFAHVKRQVRILCKADYYYRQGIREGLLERLIICW